MKYKVPKLLALGLLSLALSAGSIASECIALPGQSDIAKNAPGVPGQSNDGAPLIVVLGLCMTQAAFMSPFDVMDNFCGCKEALKKSCTRNKLGFPKARDGKPETLAQCTFFTMLY